MWNEMWDFLTRADLGSHFERLRNTYFLILNGGSMRLLRGETKDDGNVPSHSCNAPNVEHALSGATPKVLAICKTKMTMNDAFQN